MFGVARTIFGCLHAGAMPFIVRYHDEPSEALVKRSGVAQVLAAGDGHSAPIVTPPGWKGLAPYDFEHLWK